MCHKPGMSACGGGSCGIQKVRERERVAVQAAVDAAYPGRVWRPDPLVGSPLSRGRVRALAAGLEALLPVRAFMREATIEGDCDWIYLLAGLHSDCLFERSAGLAAGGDSLRSEETYLRIGFSRLGPQVTLQETRFFLEKDELGLTIEERPCLGVEDRRLQLIVKGTQGFLQHQKLVTLDMAYLVEPLEGASGSEEATTQRWSFLFEATPPAACRLVALDG